MPRPKSNIVNESILRKTNVKKEIVKKVVPKVLNETINRINKLELTVRLKNDPVKTTIKAHVAGGVEFDAGQVNCQWAGLNFSMLSVYDQKVLLEFMKLKKDDKITIKGSVYNTLNQKSKKYFLSFRVDEFFINKKVPRKRTKS